MKFHLDSDLNRQLVFQDTWMHGNLAIFFQILYRRFFEYLDMGYRHIFRVFEHGISYSQFLVFFVSLNFSTW
ncbi:unnamed protein product [Rhizophagus irregularis]|nr:unnamed protein product [Rhizophagus irregularis]